MRFSRFLLILFALILIILSVYFLTRPHEPRKLVIPTVISSQSLSPTVSITVDFETDDTLYNLILSGKAYRCHWYKDQAEDDNPFSKGQILLFNKNALAVSSGSNGKNSLQMHMVFASGSAYLWQDTNKSKIGYKLTQNDYVSAESNMSPEKRLYVAQLRDVMHFSCRNWTGAKSTFTPPKDIIFRSGL